MLVARLVNSGSKQHHFNLIEPKKLWQVGVLNLTMPRQEWRDKSGQTSALSWKKAKMLLHPAPSLQLLPRALRALLLHLHKAVLRLAEHTVHAAPGGTPLLCMPAGLGQKCATRLESESICFNGLGQWDAALSKICVIPVFVAHNNIAKRTFWDQVQALEAI